MDDVSYGALALALTLVAGTWTWFAYRRHGLAAGLKGAGITVLPIAAYLTRTLRLLGEIGSAVGDWAASLVFSPVVWVGVVLAGLGVVLYGAGRVVERRGGGATAAGGAATRSELPAARPAGSRTSGRAAAPIDDDLADIEALLKNRGIT